jgi:hypothetical protein
MAMMQNCAKTNVEQIKNNMRETIFIYTLLGILFKEKYFKIFQVNSTCFKIFQTNSKYFKEPF